MAKAAFHKSQRVYVKPVGTWAVIEEVLPQWVKGLDEPLKVLYDVGLGREFSASELTADKAKGPTDDLANLDAWRIMRAPNRWKTAEEAESHPYPGTHPIIVTDEKDWGGWRVPNAEYDRDPEKIEFQARIICTAPHLMRMAKTLVDIVSRNPHDVPNDVLATAKQATALLRHIYETEAAAEAGEAPETMAAS